ncbi:MAG: hypothetical protein R3D46_08455 [Defluviimonas denitrificans]
MIATPDWMKAGAVAAAETTITALLLRAGAGAMAAHRLRRAWCDASAFEYMEGVTNIHRLNAAHEFRSHGRHSDV